MTRVTLPRGPNGSPLIGNALGLWRGGLPSLRECALEYGDLVPIRLLWKRFLFVNCPDYAAQALATSHQKVAKSVARASDYILLGDGISLKEGEDWRRERRLMQPSFHRDRMAAYGEDVVALTERAIEGWRGGETRDVFEEMGRLTMAIVGKALLGVDVSGEDSDSTAALSDALRSRDAHARSPSMLLPSQLPTPSNLRMWRARRRLDRILQRVIDRRRAQQSRAPGDDRGDLLSTLLAERNADGQAKSDRQVRSEILTVFVGGHETVADLLTWTWYLLSQHAEVEARLVAELDAAIGHRAPTATDLPNLRYAGTVVAEVLRLYPPASILIREATAEIEIGGYRVARGTEVVISPWVLHRDPRYFSDPEAFNPDRWADGLASRLPHYAYLPFGGGPRICIGRSFAMLEAILVTAVIAQRFHLVLVPGQRVVAEPIPTLHPKRGLRMVVHPRSCGEVGHQPTSTILSAGTAR